MASKSLGTLTVDLIAKVGGFVDGMDQAQRASRKRYEALEKDTKRSQNAINRTLKSLDEEVALLGKTGSEARLMKLEMQGATKAQLDQAKASLKVIDAHQKQLKTQAKMIDTAKTMGKVAIAAATAIGAAVVAAGASAVERAREIDNLSKVANTGAETFQRWAAGTRTVGIEQDKLADILKDMSDRVGDFLSTGGGPMADFFENIAPQVGVTAEQFRNLSGPQALQLYVSSLEKANLSQNEMAFYMEAIASDSTALLPLLRDNGAEIGRLGDRAAELGAVLSDIEVEQLAEVRREMDFLGESFKAVGNDIAIEALPYIREFTEMMQDPETVEGIKTLTDATIRFGAALVGVAAEGSKEFVNLGEQIAANVAKMTGQLTPLDKIKQDIKDVDRALNNSFFGKPIKYLFTSDEELIAEKKRLQDLKAAIVGVAETTEDSMEAVSTALDKYFSQEAKQYGKTGQQIAESNKKAEQSEKDFIASVAEAAKQLAKTREEQRKFNEARDAAIATAQIGVDELQRQIAVVGQGEEAQAALNRELFKESIIRSELYQKSGPEYRKELLRIQMQQYDLKEVLAEVTEEHQKQEEAAKAAAQEMIRVWQEATNRIDEAFADAWKGAFGSFDDFSDQLKDAFKQLLAELAHMAITKPILIQLGLGGSGTGGVIDQLTSNGSGGLGDVSSLLGLFTGSTPLAGLGMTLQDFALNNPAMGGLFDVGTNMASLSTMDIGLSALAAYAGDYLGSEVGKALFGKEAESNIATTIGGIGGTLIGGPLGSLIGSSLGALLDTAFGGDGYSRQAVGANVAPYRAGQQSTGYETFGASGLRYYGMTEGDGDADLANQFADILAATDTAITSLAAMYGVNAQGRLEGQALLGSNSQGEWGPNFFGSLDGSDLDAALEAFEDALADRFNHLTKAAIDLDAIRGMMREGEALGDTIYRIQGEIVVVNELFNTLGISTIDLSTAGLEAADRLVQAAGGLDALVTATDYYYQNVYSETERAQMLYDQHAQTIANFNDTYGTAITSTDELRAYVDQLTESQNWGSEATQAAWLAAIQLTPALVEQARAMDILAPAIENVSDAVTDAVNEIQQGLTQGELTTLSDISSTIFDNYQTDAQTLDDLRERLSDINAEIEDITGGVAAVIEPLPDIVTQAAASIDTLTFSSSQLRGVADNLKGLVASLSLSDLSSLTNLEQLNFAQAQYQQAQRAARNGDPSQIAGAAQAYLQEARSYFASSPEYSAIFSDVVGYLSDMGVEIESDAERAERAERAQQAALDVISTTTSETLTQQIDYATLDKLIQEKQLVEAQISNLNAANSLGVMEDQLGHLVSITDGIDSVADLLGNLPMTLADEIAAVLGVAITDYRGLTDVESFFANLPQFAEGGIAAGPNSGYLAMLHGTEVITPMKNYSPPTAAGGMVETLLAGINDRLDSLENTVSRDGKTAQGQRQQQIQHAQSAARNSKQNVKVFG